MNSARIFPKTISVTPFRRARSKPARRRRQLNPQIKRAADDADYTDGVPRNPRSIGIPYQRHREEDEILVSLQAARTQGECRSDTKHQAIGIAPGKTSQLAGCAAACEIQLRFQAEPPSAAPSLQ